MSSFRVKTVSSLLAASLCALILGGMASSSRGESASMKLASSAFPSDGTIPKKCTCDGADVSPPLAWSDPPGGTKTFALIMDDPDAPMGTWVHWVLYDMPASTRDLPENVPKQNQLSSGARQGRNDFPSIGFGGPCPPPGAAHRYFFKLYALDAKLDLKPGSSKAALEKAMQGHILAEAQLIGRYARGR